MCLFAPGKSFAEILEYHVDLCSVNGSCRESSSKNDDIVEYCNSSELLSS